MTSTRRGSLPIAVGQRDGARAGVDGGEIDDAALGLGDDLLRHHQHVAIFQCVSGTTQYRNDQRGEIVAGLDHGQIRRGKQLQRGNVRHRWDYVGSRYGFPPYAKARRSFGNTTSP